MRRCSTQLIRIEHLAAAHHLGQISVEVGLRANAWQLRRRRDDDTGRPGRNLPQSRGAGFLDFGVRRQVLEGQHIVGGQADHGIG